MKYFLDTEFIENGKTIDLISIGIVDENGREYYAVNQECDFSKADEWVKENVLKPMGLRHNGMGLPLGLTYSSDKAVDFSLYTPMEKQTVKSLKPRQQIKEELQEFLATGEVTNLTRFIEDDYAKIEFWGAWCAYDWVVFCQLWGKMIDLPKGFPYHCNDVIQWMNQEGLKRSDLPPSPENEHNALADARWVKSAWETISELRTLNVQDVLTAKYQEKFKMTTDKIELKPTYDHVFWAGLVVRLKKTADALSLELDVAAPRLKPYITCFSAASLELADVILSVQKVLADGDFNTVQQKLKGCSAFVGKIITEVSSTPRHLRSANHPAALYATNALDDMYTAQEAISKIEKSLAKLDGAWPDEV